MTASLGELEQLVLLALLRLGEEGYGVTVQAELLERAGRGVNLGSIYKALLRLEEKGLVVARVGEPTAIRGGRRKKHYALTRAGQRALVQALGALRSLSRGLPEPLWEGKSR